MRFYKSKQFLFMQIDQRFVQNLQNENMMMRQEINRLNGVAKTLDQKYQKSLKEMSSIIQANQNLKKELDNIKTANKDQVENSLREMRAAYEKKIQQMVIQKNDIYVNSQNLLREKQQLQRDYSSIERTLWQTEALKTQISALKKQNQKLLLQTHPLTQNQDNPEHKAIEQKLSQKIEDLNSKIIQLNVQSTQSRKWAESLESEKQNLLKENDSLNKKINQLSSALERASSQTPKEANLEAENKVLQAKRYQMESMELRKQNAQLTNQIQKLKLERLQITSEINKNEAELHLLSTLKSLHSQLEPMRYEIEELKRDKYFDRESSNKEKAELQMKLLSNQHELQTQKQYIKDLESRAKDLAQQIRQKQWQKNKYQQLQQQKRILEGRVIVYQAMQMVTRNRDKPHHIERLQQFQRRIQLLLEEQNLQYLVNNANVHQLIAMKAYIIELDNKLQLILEQNEHMHKRYSQYKEKYQTMVGENKQIVNKHYAMVNAYKGKVAGYEKLVIKLTEELERYIKDTQGPSGIESHYKSVITLYQSKITSIHNEVNAKKQQNRQLLKKFQNLELQHRGKLALIRELQVELSNTKTQVKELGNKLAVKSLDEQQPRSSFGNVPEDHYRGIIAQKTKEILELEDSLSKLKFKMDKMEFQHDRDLDNYKHKISRLEIQIQHLSLEQESATKQISTAKHSEDFGELVHKLSSLEKNMAAISKSQVSVQPQPRDSTADLQRQIDSLRQENQRLTIELQNIRVELKRRVSEQNNQFLVKEFTNEDQINKFKDQANRNILQLQNRINQLEAELKIKMKESEIKSREIQRGNMDKSNVLVQPTQVPSNAVGINTALQEQNSHLRTELDRIRASYKSMTIQSEGLMVKIKDTEAYISTLKEQFDRVCAKMNQYQRQLNNKDEKLREWNLKYGNLQHQLDSEVSKAKSSTGAINDKEIQQRLQQIKESELQIQRAFREIDSKVRDIERRQMEANRRDSEIDMKNKDLKDRIRKVQERERIVSDQENRLIKWSQELEDRERRIQASFTQPVITPTINQPAEPTYKDEFHELERKMKRLEIELTQKLKIIQIKDEKMDKLIKEKAELSRAFEEARGALDQRVRSADGNERQVTNLKQELTRLEGELERLWKEFDLLKQQLRNKEREISDGALEKEEVKTKLEIEIRQLNFRIKELESSRSSFSPPAPAKNVPNFNEIQKQFEDKLREIEQRHKQKIRELYKENEENSRELQQTISELSSELSRYKVQSPSQNKNELQSHTQTIQSLESHIKTLEDEVHRKQGIINQLEEDLRYYKDILSQREEELHKLYESTYMPSNTSHADNDNADKIRLQNEIISLQMMLKSKNNESLGKDHDECIKKEHLLRMEIQRLNGILQSKMSDHDQTNIHAEEKPQSSRSHYLDNSYLNELEETNRNLEADLHELKNRLIANFDQSRSIDEYLAILVITFAEVDALRQRNHELEQNFKQEHERQMNVIKKIDEINEKNIDIEKILEILKELEASHRAFHEEEERSKTTFIKRINTEVIVMPGSQALSINEEINRNRTVNEQSELSSRNQFGSFELRKFDEVNKIKPIDYGERSIKNSLMEDSLSMNTSAYQPSLTTNQFNFSSLPMSNTTSLGINRGFISQSSQSQSQPTGSYGFNLQSVQMSSNFNPSLGAVNPPSVDSSFNRAGGYEGPALTKIQFNSSSNPVLNSQFGSLGPMNYSTIPIPMPQPRPGSIPSVNQPPPAFGMSPSKPIDRSPGKFQQFSPNKRMQITQPYQFYQYSQGSQSSMRFPSETNIAPPPGVTFRSSETNVSPYIMSSNQLYR